MLTICRLTCYVNFGLFLWWYNMLEGASLMVPLHRRRIDFAWRYLLDPNT